MRVWTEVFITSRQPKRALRLVRRIRGVVHADALFGSPDVVAIVAGDGIARMDAVIDRIAALPLVAGTDSKESALDLWGRVPFGFASGGR